MRYLITCCKVKNNPVDRNDSVSKSLLDLSFAELNPIREQLQDAAKINLNWRCTLPAYEVYKGKLYSQVNKINWTKSTTEVMILSALFGWIKHTDFIPYYDLRMNDMITAGIKKMSVWNFWKEKGELGTFIKPNDIDLLSDNYRKALNPMASTIASRPQVTFSDSYGVAKGKWLNGQL